MSIERVNPPDLAKPAGFSHAVVGVGTTVFLAGQTSMDRDGAIVGGTVVEQFRQSLTNLLAALHAAGGTPDQLASITIYSTDLADYRSHAREIGAAWRELVGSHYPAMAGIGVSRLWDDEAMVEISGFAVLGG